MIKKVTHPIYLWKIYKIILILKHLKLDAYLRSLGLSVGKKLFFSLCLSYFVQLLVYPVTVFCLGIQKMQVSHTCIQIAENSICYVV